MKNNGDLFAHCQGFIDYALDTSTAKMDDADVFLAIIARQLIQQNVVLGEIRNALEEMAGIHRGV